MKPAPSTKATPENFQAVISLLTAMPSRLEQLSQKSLTEQLRQPLGTGQRSATEVLAHLLNCEARSSEAIYAALLVNEPEVIEIHPERQWGKLLQYQQFTFAELLAYFTLRRTVLVRVLSTLKPKQWQRTGREAGKQRQETVYWKARALALHEAEHLAELEAKVSH
jgi:hypothetical protein